MLAGVVCHWSPWLMASCGASARRRPACASSLGAGVPVIVRRRAAGDRPLFRASINLNSGLAMASTMAGRNRVNIVVDERGGGTGLPGEVIGRGSIDSDRVVQALACNGYETGPVLINAGEYLGDSLGGIVSDAENNILGFAPVWVDRFVEASG